MGSESRGCTMRTVSLVEHIDLEFKGNVIPQTMLLADVDNDSANELIVGNISGDVAIFKGDSPSQPWKKISLSGMLTCLSVGEVLLQKKNNLVCMTAEGWCYVYDVSCLYTNSTCQSIIPSDEGSEKAILTQELPANARVMCLADIDMDGRVEMIIGYADRVVRAFRWQEAHDSPCGHFVVIQKWQLAGQIGNMTINYSTHYLPELMVSQPGGTFVSLKIKPSFRHVRSDGQINIPASGMRHGLTSLERSGSFAGASRHNSSSKLNSSVQSIDMLVSRDSPGPANQSDTLSTQSEASYRSLENVSLRGMEGLGRTSRGRLQKSVSDADQPSSRKDSAQMECSSEEDLRNSIFKSPVHTSSAEKLDQGMKNGREGVEDLTSPVLRKARGRPINELDVSFDNEDMGIVYHPLASHVTGNENSSTFIIGAVRKMASQSDKDMPDANNTEETYYAVATLDGSVVLVDNEDSIIWSLQMGYELFALSKLDVTGDGKEEVICCCWNGQTYIINHEKEIVSYHFPDNVAAFCAGGYSVYERINVPCFVYATTNGRIYIYYNVILPRLKLRNLSETLASKTVTAELLAKLNIKSDDSKSLQQLYHWCLYGKMENRF